MISRLPPSDTSAEAALIASCLLDWPGTAEARRGLTPADFYAPRHASMWRACLDLESSGRSVDAVALATALREGGRLAEVGGPEAVLAVADAASSPVHAGHHGETVRDRARARAIAHLGDRVAEAAYSGRPAQECLQIAQDGLQGILVAGSAKGPSSIQDALYAVLARLERAEEKDPDSTTSGLWPLDDLLAGGWHRGEVVVVAARPSVGKSTFATNAALAAAKAGVGVAIFSLEMTAESLGRAALASEARLDSQRLRRGRRAMLAQQADHAAKTASGMMGLPIWIFDSASATPATIRSDLQALMMREPKVGLCVIDYLGLMSGEGDSRQQEVDAMARAVKVLAKDAGVPVLLVAQLNRMVEHRDGNRPRLSDLKDSGGVEANADVVLLLHRPFMYSRNKAEMNEAVCIVAKNRHGPCEDVRLRFDAEFNLFSVPNMDRRTE